MAHHVFRNSAEALYRMSVALRNAPETGSRVGMSRELMAETITLTNPRERFHWLKGRNANPFAQIAETLWVLAGRNDIGWLSAYLPRAKDFSDDGVTWRAGYGPRLREWASTESAALHPDNWPLDQLHETASLLALHPDTRRAVISLWDPALDLGAESKDVPCLAGETLLRSPEGDMPIADVAEKFSSGEVRRWPIYAVDPNTLEQRIRWATRVWQSGIKPTIRLRFDDGSVLRLTPEHTLYRKSGSAGHMTVQPCAAGMLRPGDHVLATRRFYGQKGHETHKRRLNVNTAFSNMRNTHQAYVELLYGNIPGGYDVHHINGVKTDNRAENLALLVHGEHSALKMMGDDNPMRRLTPEQHAHRANKQSKSLAANWSMQPQERKERQRVSMRQAQVIRAEQQRAARDNHVVVAVEDGGTVPVYDFTVEGEHTALVGTGVVAHNCNNWLQFVMRENELDMHIAVRSNDLWWGFSGINTFEWSVLHELLAHEVGANVGEATYFIGSLHLYERHWKQADEMIRQYAPASAQHYDHLFQPAIETPLDELDSKLANFFEVEKEYRLGNYDAANDLLAYMRLDPFVRTALSVLRCYWQYQRDGDPMLAASALAALPPSDQREATLEWMTRQKPKPPATDPSPDSTIPEAAHAIANDIVEDARQAATEKEQEYPDPHDQPYSSPPCAVCGSPALATVQSTDSDKTFYLCPAHAYPVSAEDEAARDAVLLGRGKPYSAPPTGTDLGNAEAACDAQRWQNASWLDICDLLIHLQTSKGRTYGDSWKKRGELVSIFGNLARKHDRLEKLMSGEKGTASEGVLDTIADLAVYGCLYYGWLHTPHNQQPDFTHDLRSLGLYGVSNAVTYWTLVRAAFGNLEHTLLHAKKLSDDETQLHEYKTTAAAQLVRYCVCWLTQSARRMPADFAQFANAVLAED